MKKLWCGTISVILVVVMLINMLPLNALAVDNNSTVTMSEMPVMQETVLDTIPSADSTEIEQIDEVLPAYVVEEDISKRSEFFKEFILSNGLRLATIYPDAVHYENNGQWEEINNTLVAKVIEGQNVYTNTSGLWEVHFPQRLNGTNAISITKDGFTVSFGMAGEIRSNGDVVAAAMGNEAETNTATILPIAGNTIDSVAQVQQIDTATAKADAEYADTIPETLHSRLIYPSVYNGTNIVYDLQSNQVKESVILRSPDSALIGYRYTLNTGGLVPIFNSDQSIHLCDPDTDDIVMTMPAPFMLDANDEYCEDITVSLVQSGNGYILSYHLPMEWLSAEDRAWPVVLDPVVSANNARNNIQDITVAENGTESNNDPTIKCGYGPTKGIMRTYLRFKELPALTSSDVIVNATITLRKPYNSTLPAPIYVYKVTTPWEASQINWANKPYFGPTVEDMVVVQNPLKYEWDITDIVYGWYADTVNTLQNNTGMMFKASDDIESAAQNNWQQFCSSDNTTFTDTLTPTLAETRPVLTIEYINSAGLENYWDYSSNSAGRAGTGYIQPYSGNLTWVHTDIGFDGNRMPVSINHIYNASEASSGSNLFGIGIGWRTNYNQRIVFDQDGAPVWEDSDGTSHVFVFSSGDWKDTDDLGLTFDLLSITDAEYEIADKYGNTSEFDSEGRLIRQINNQQTKSIIEISYDGASSKRISQIKDGAGRQYQFLYGNDGLLDSIIYHGINTDSDTDPISSISFSYTNSRLTSITYADGKTTTFAYTSSSLLSSATDIDGYKISYNYNTLHAGKPTRVISVSESAGTQIGGTTTFSYSFNRTVVTDHNGNAQTYFFNGCGNTVSVQDSEGRATIYRYETDNPNYGIRNRLLESSQQQDTVINLIKDHSFENGTEWNTNSSQINCENINASTSDENTAYLGTHYLVSECSGSGQGETGAFSGTYSVAAGTSVTFSAYVKLVSGSVRLLISGTPSGYAESDILDIPGEWTRLEATYCNDTDSAVQITVAVFHIEPGKAYVDCVQLERTSAASRYNLLENADISFGYYGWFSGGQSITEADTSFSTPPPNLSANIIEIHGNANSQKTIYQTVNISGNANDTFVFGGWMRKSSLPDSTRAIKLTINNNDGTTLSASVSPNLHLPDYNGWQYIVGSVVAAKSYNSVTFSIEFGSDPNHIYIDGLQLFREAFSETYEYDSNGNVIETTDILGLKTVYTYDRQTNNLLSVTEPDGTKITYTYDAYHNVKRSVLAYQIGDYSWETAYEENYNYDEFGNLTYHSYFTDRTSKTTLYRYTEDGNFLSWTQDALENITYYGYNQDNSTLEWIQYPNDTETTRQTFEYDEHTFRLVESSAAPTQSNQMYALYSYSNDQLSRIQTPKTTYLFDYNAWGERETVKIGNSTLAAYHYSSDADRNLIQLDYGNGDVVKYEYDHLGRVTQESYYESGAQAPSRTVTYSYDSNGALVTTSDSKTGRTTKCYYDSVGRVSRQRTTDLSASHNLYFTYDALGQVAQVRETYKPSENASTEENLTEYSYANGWVISVHNDGSTPSDDADDSYVYYSYDRFDRVDEKIIAWGQNTNQLVLNETLTYNKLDQVTSLVLDAEGFDRSYTYEYDGNGNITKITYGGQSIEYVYDSQNQLIRENNQITGKTWVWSYDAAGNIISKTQFAYTTAQQPTQGSASFSYQYGNAFWGDLLTNYNGKPITYDAIGNPLSDGTWTYTWEQGRQLARMTAATGAVWNFTYDANGMRMGRTGSGGSYTYIYNGSRLSRMYSSGANLAFTYGADSKPLSVKYNGITYYYVTNLQGDVIAILDSSGTMVVEYTYDAWGKLLTTTGTMANTLGLHNPLRYRGYVYDRETGLYYLQSRYYNPEWGRFINADRQLTSGLLGGNLFAYCLNNPVNAVDSTGNSTEALYWWTTAMSWLPFADTALPIGDLVYAAGILVLGTITYEVSDDISLDFASDEVDVAYSPPSPDNDDDDDYYDDDDNFGGRERVGKIKGNAPRNNKVQNQKFDYAARKAGIKVEKHRAFHDYMSGRGEGLDELLEMAKTFVSLVLIFL